MSREPLEFIEIDVPKCTRTYGSSPCVAALGVTGKRKCFNTRATCQDTAHFVAGTPLTLVFSRRGRPLPKGVTAFAAIEDLRMSSATVNIASSDPNYGQLGKRATMEIRLKDFTWHDRGTDPYVAGRRDGSAQIDEPGYDPAKRGSFLPKLKARWPNYVGGVIRRKVGYLVNGALTNVETFTMYLTEMKGPNEDGSFTIRAIDVLDFANEKTALCPKPSQGSILSDINNSVTSLTVTPSGIGATYPASGRIQVSSEMMTFTRSGDAFTITRGTDGTVAASHRAGDAVQIVKSWSLARLDDIVVDLLTNYTKTPNSWLDTGVWASEVTRWAPDILCTTKIGTPTSVATLLAELGDLGCTIAPDDRAGKIRLRMNRPIFGETVYQANRNTIKALVQEDRDADRVTQVLFCHKRNDPTKALNDESNYSHKLLNVNASAVTLYDEARTRKLFTRWLDQGDDTTASIISSRLLQRFENAPMRIFITFDAISKAISLMDVVNLTSELLSDPTGATVTRLMQVIQRSEPIAYHEIEVELQKFDFTRQYAFIMADTANVYGSATDTEKNTGGYISNGNTAFSDGREPYRII